jgi:hypothetical protein
MFRTEDMALETIYQQINDVSFDAHFCPLRRT